MGAVITLLFSLSAHWANGRAWPGKAAAWAVGSNGSSSLQVKGSDGVVCDTPLVGPVVFDPSLQFKSLTTSVETVFMIAYQSELRDSLTKKMQSRLKALGCSCDDPEAWTALR